MNGIFIRKWLFLSYTILCFYWYKAPFLIRAFAFLVSFAMVLALHHVEAHRARGAFNDLRCSVDVVRVEILHLGLGDLGQLAGLDRADDVLARLFRTRLDLHRLLDEEAGGRRLRDEGEAAIRIDRDLGRDRSALFKVLRRGVERLAEFHDVHAALTQRRADRRRGVGGAGGHLKVDVTFDLLGHERPPFLTVA